MNFTLFQKGIKDIAKDEIAESVGFHVLGEPLLYPRFIDALRFAKSYGLRTELNTNGSLLTQDLVDQLIDARLDRLAISVETINEKDYECRGSRIPFQIYYKRVIDAVKHIKYLNSEMDIELCLMNTQTKKFFDIEKSIRLDSEKESFEQKLTLFIFDVLSAIGKPKSFESIQYKLKKVILNRPQLIQIDDHIDVLVQLLADWGNAFTSKRIHPSKFGFCGLAFNNIGVLNNGEVTICCVDYDGKTSLGNIQDKSLGSILSSKKAQEIRDGYKKNKIVNPICQMCFGSSHRVKSVIKGLMSIYLFKVLKYQPPRVKEVVLF
jgi:radical SAM protein with 4Fe4S-binding SPASM domain